MSATKLEAGAPSPPAATPVRRDIQGLRAIAVLAVIAFHAGLPVPGGFIGVDVFFVISGFVITALLHREWLSTGTIRFRRFYVRRFKRLTPALALMVSITVVLSIAILSPFGTQQVTAQTAIGAMFLAANLVISRSTGGYFDSAAEINPLLNTWSLSVEEQFYLVFPAVLFSGWWVARRLGRAKAIPGLLVLLVAMMSFGAAYLNAAGQLGPRTEFLFGFYGPASRAWEFAIGALIALNLPRISRLSAGVAQFLGFLGALGLGASLFVITESTPFPGPWTLLPVLSTAALIVAGSAMPSAVSRLLSTRPMVIVGDYSYSLYLWHWPLIVFASLIWPMNSAVLVVAAVLSVGPAVASYRWLEQPIRRAPNPPRGRLVALFSVAVLVPSILAVGLWVGANKSWGIGDLSGARTAQQTWERLSEECLDLSTTFSVTSQVGAEGCTWNPEGSGKPVYLVGDSAAAQYLAGVRSAADKFDSPLRLIAAAHCPLTTASRVNNTTGEVTDLACAAHNAEALRILESSPPGVVLLATSNRYWYVDDDLFVTAPGNRQVTIEQSRATLEEGLLSAVDALRYAGQRVVVLSPTYTFLNGQLSTPERMPIFRLAAGSEGLGVDVGDLEPGQLEARKAIERVSEATGAQLIDFEAWQCPQSRCPALIGEALVYADSAHLSQQVSALLVERFAAVIGGSSASD